ncbi:methyl-accepting chemotaxis protein [Salipaludibacillus sp. CF4.18]|uniref:methyl-accepting chemotaxis protein n=1 Tax=Salipaludibacillus sp. CF4.18 TaxID=3373081 RepID=UPI003EE8173A
MKKVGITFLVSLLGTVLFYLVTSSMFNSFEALVLLGVIFIPFLLKDVIELKRKSNPDAQNAVVTDIQKYEHQEESNAEENSSLDKYEELTRKLEEQLVNQEDEYMTFNSIVFQLAEGIQTQSVSAEDSSKGMNEMAAGINSIAEKTSLAASASTEAAKAANEGKVQMGELGEQMERIIQTFGGLGTTVEEFNEKSKEIGKIINDIRGIADQTNLLSLNASIEAARAGAEGKGFAVVAQEVGKLSKQSNEFAEQITILVSTIQDKAGNAQEAMDTSHEELNKGKQLVKESDSSFEGIMSSSQLVHGQIEEITAISQEMAAGSEQVAASMTEISNVANKSSEQFNELIPVVISQFDSTNMMVDSLKEMKAVGKNPHEEENSVKPA